MSGMETGTPSAHRDNYTHLWLDPSIAVMLTVQFLSLLDRSEKQIRGNLLQEARSC